MYTVPAKVTVQAKTLISAIEKGEFSSLNPVEYGEEGPRPLHPELSTVELAEPGTAKKLLFAFETKRQESLTSPTTPNGGRTSSFSSTRKLSSNIFSEFETQSSLTETTKRSSVVTSHVVNDVTVSDGLPAEFVITSGHETHDALASVQTGQEEQLTLSRSAVGTHSVHLEQSTAEPSAAAVLAVSPSLDTSRAEHEAVVSEIISVHTATDQSPTVAADPIAAAVTPVAVTTPAVTPVAVTTAAVSPVAVTTPAVTPVAVTSAAVTPVAVTTVEVGLTSHRRNVLIVTGVKHGTSLDAALSAATVRTFTDAGDDVIVTDVYNLKRDQNGSEDFGEEQRKLLRADLIVFQYRTVLNTVPAAIKAWCENVLIDRSQATLLKVKKTVLLVTTEAERKAHDADTGTLCDINACLSSIQTGILRFVGLNVLSPQLICGAGDTLDDQERAAITKYWAARLQHIWKEKGVFE